MSTVARRPDTAPDLRRLPLVEFWESDVEVYPAVNPWVAPFLLYVLPLTVIVAIGLTVAYTR